MKYKHLAPHQRYTISVMLQRQMTMTVIAQTIGITKATVSREVKRNCDKRGKHAYRWDLAQRKYEKRMKQRPHYIKFSDEMKRDVRRLIVYGQYSPEQIAGRYKRDEKPMVCKETIYKWVWAEKRNGHPEMAQNLMHHGRRKRKCGGEYKSRGQIVDRVDISLRPPEVDEKLHFSDFEIDTIIGKNRKGAVMTINDRCTKIVFIRRLTGKEADPLANLEYFKKIYNFDFGSRCTSN